MEVSKKINPLSAVKYATLGESKEETITETPTEVIENKEVGEEPKEPKEVEEVAEPKVENVSPDVKEEVEDTSQPEPKINVYYAVQRHLLEEGLIKEEDLKRDATYEDVEAVLKGRVYEEVKQQVEQEYEAKGYNERSIMYGQMIEQGLDPEAVKPINRLYQIASLKGRDDLNEDQKTQVIQSMYQYKKYEPNEYSVIIDNAKKSESPEDFENLYNAALDYHQRSYDQIKADHEQKQAEIEKQVKQKQKEAEAQLKKIFEKKKVADVEFSEEQSKKLKTAIYNRDRVFTYNGQQQTGSAMDEFIANFLESDEMKIKAYLLFKEGDNLKKVAKNRAKISLEKELMEAAQYDVIKEEKSKPENISLRAARVY